ncbi:replication initiator protein A [Candidatus Bipolaricaulota bacterium]|nr:replication initiator protein A [Candidatus Bipolaricaulota bacterium]
MPSEANLLLLPFFALSRQDAASKERMKYEKEVQRDEGREVITWEVSASSKYGYPGPFDKNVYKAVEEIITREDFPVKNPIEFSLYKLLKLMGRKSPGGRDYRQVRQSLEKLTATTIKSKGSFYLKGRCKYLDDVFSLFSRVTFTGEEKKDGGRAEKNYLFLNSFFLENINEFYMRPLDYQFYKGLDGEITKRLYELLGVKFFPIVKQDKPSLRFSYDTLTKLIPLRKQDYPSKAKQVLSPAHKELADKDFLSGVDWKKKRDSLLIYYYPGERSVREIKGN